MAKLKLFFTIASFFVLSVSVRNAWAQGDEPLEGIHYVVRKGDNPDWTYLEIARDANIFGRALATKLGVTLFELRTDNPNTTFPLCNVNGKYRSGIHSKDAQSRYRERSSNAVWAGCAPENQEVYVVPGETIILTGVKRFAPEEITQALSDLKACTDVPCTVRQARILGAKIPEAPDASLVVPQPAPMVAETPVPIPPPAVPDGPPTPTSLNTSAADDGEIFRLSDDLDAALLDLEDAETRARAAEGRIVALERRLNTQKPSVIPAKLAGDVPKSIRRANAQRDEAIAIASRHERNLYVLGFLVLLSSVIALIYRRLWQRSRGLQVASSSALMQLKQAHARLREDWTAECERSQRLELALQTAQEEHAASLAGLAKEYRDLAASAERTERKRAYAERHISKLRSLLDTVLRQFAGNAMASVVRTGSWRPLRKALVTGVRHPADRDSSRTMSEHLLLANMRSFLEDLRQRILGKRFKWNRGGSLEDVRAEQEKILAYLDFAQTEYAAAVSALGRLVDGKGRVVMDRSFDPARLNDLADALRVAGDSLPTVPDSSVLLARIAASRIPQTLPGPKPVLGDAEHPASGELPPLPSGFDAGPSPSRKLTIYAPVAPPAPGSVTPESDSEHGSGVRSRPNSRRVPHVVHEMLPLLQKWEVIRVGSERELTPFLEAARRIATLAITVQTIEGADRIPLRDLPNREIKFAA